MYLDAFTLSALVDEFMDSLVGGRVQDSVAVDDDSIGLEIYANHRRQYLYISANPAQPRVHLAGDRLRRGVSKPSTLGLLIRRYVEGGGIAHVSQPAWERVIQIDVQGPEGDVSLIVEPMERRSNLLLVQNGIILDCARRVGADENRYRVSLPNHPYIPPPPQMGKLDPLTLTLEGMTGIFAQNDDPKKKIHQLLTARLLGVSPLVARETVYRVTRSTETKVGDADSEKLLAALKSIVEPLGRREWQPGVAEGERGVTAFSVYPLESVEGWRRVESVSAALTLFYSAPVGEDAYNAAKKPVHDEIAEAKSKIDGRLISLRRSLKDESERETLKQSGELILAYQYAIGKGQTELKAQYDLDAPELVIKIDPEITPLENAQRYFDKYNRAKRALEDVPSLIDEAEHESEFLAQLDTDVALASNWTEIDEVVQTLQARGYWRGKPTQKIGGQKSAPMRVVTPDGFVIWIGRNSRQNEIVTFDKGSPLDWWLHARGVPGSHVIVKFDGREIPEPVLERAAALAAHYSASRGEGKVIVDVTQRRYVRKVKGGAVGMVTYRNEETRTVTPSGDTEV